MAIAMSDRMRCDLGPAFMVCGVAARPQAHLYVRRSTKMNQRKLWRLRDEHRWLESRIRQELRRPQPDAYVVLDLKRRKLRVKDEIFLAEAGLVPVRA